MTVATLAETLGQHPNTVREHLDALVDAAVLFKTSDRLYCSLFPHRVAA